MEKPICWCGSRNLEFFSEYYYKCKECGTILNKKTATSGFPSVVDKAEEFYGEHYWMKFVVEEYGMPNIAERSQNDLAERNVYWLNTILQYKLPPAKTLELGCAHGGFVFLMRQAGYDAAGSEMSQWICDYARKTFEIPMLCGKIEELELSQKTYDLILLMDVLEHMTDPLTALRSICSALKEDGVVVIQTPCFRELGRTFDELKAGGSPFLPMLAEKEHIFLFTQASVVRILTEGGFSHVEFEVPIFPYDMFIFAGKKSLNKVKKEEAVAELLKTPERRLVLALVDLYEQKAQRESSLLVCEKDRAARLEVIERQRQEFERQGQEFAAKLSEIERDRAARLEVIERQRQEFERQGQEFERQRQEFERQRQEFAAKLSEVEGDRAARLEVMERQAGTIEMLEESLRIQGETIKKREEEIRRLDIIQHDLGKALDQIKNSVSWRMTAPFRQIADLANDVASKRR